MHTWWKNLYPGKNSGVHIAGDNPDDIYQLMESLLETIGAWDSRITRTGALEALAIAENVLSTLENPVKENEMFGDDDYQDIDSDSFTTVCSSRAFRRSKPSQMPAVACTAVTKRLQIQTSTKELKGDDHGYYDTNSKKRVPSG